jgi:protein gp37
MPTAIPWTDETWNPMHGCTQISDGCKNCYAKTMAETRLRGKFGYPKKEPFKVVTNKAKLTEPHQWARGRFVFVCSMGDLYHDDVPFDFIADVYSVMNQCPHHVFQMLTKRPKRMYNVTAKLRKMGRPAGPHIWHGCTIEDLKQKKRAKWLRKIPGIRFISIEPMLTGVDVREFLEGDDKIHWVIAGCEKIRRSPGRPAKLDWFRALRDQCAAAGTPFHLKQVVVNGRVKSDPILDGRTHVERPQPLIGYAGGAS